ncbi:MAG: LysR family transcriptional regulator [Burkholderiales bacterium]|nr:MAG: LysR family transcriptional regulator [Burkholderiales bacterium]
MALNISLRQLVVFREVMRSGSVSEAARILHRTQPAVSTMLAGLEQELGFRLFDRKGNRLIARPEAHFLLEEAHGVLERFTRSIQLIGEVSQLQLGELRIACLPAASLFLMPRLVSEFARARPQVTVSLMSGSSAAVQDWVASQQFDLGIAEVPEARDAIEIELIDLECVCAMRRDDPLARRDEIGPHELDDRPMATLFADHFTRRQTAQAFEQAGARLRQRFELRTFISGFDFVEQGLAYCICDPISAASYRIYRGDLGTLTFRVFRPAIPYRLAILRPAHKPPSRLASEFLETTAARIREFAGEPGFGVEPLSPQSDRATTNLRKGRRARASPRAASATKRTA